MANRRYLLLLALFYSLSLSAQQFEIFGGVNSNHTYDTVNEEGKSLYSSYEAGRGFTIGFSFDNPNMNGYASRITLSYNRITGTINTDNGFFASGTSAEIDKSSLNLAVYPFTFIVKKMYFSLGLQGNYMLSTKSTGYSGYLGTEPPTTSNILQVSDPKFHKEFGYGVALRVHYSINLKSGLSIIPQYNLYYGIGEEYSTFEYEKIKVWQQVLALGIGMQF